MITRDKARKEALAFLRANRVAAVSTASSNGEPQVSAVYYIVDDDFTLWALAIGESKKIKNLRENNQVAFAVWQEKSPITAQGGGVAELFEGAAKDAIVEKFSSNFAAEKPFHWPILNLPHAEYVGIKINVKWLTWLNLDPSQPEAYEEGFYQIVP